MLCGDSNFERHLCAGKRKIVKGSIDITEDDVVNALDGLPESKSPPLSESVL